MHFLHVWCWQGTNSVSIFKKQQIWHKFSSSKSCSLTSWPPRITGAPSPLWTTSSYCLFSPFLMRTPSSWSIYSYLFMKLISLGVLLSSNNLQTASLSLVNRESPLSLKTSVFSNKVSSVSYLLFSSDSCCFIPMDKLTRIPIIGARYYSNVAECEYTLSLKNTIALSISPIKILLRVNITKFNKREECTWSLSKNSSGHQVAKSSHILSRSIEVSKYYLVLRRVKLL